jgi:hypothetical protein
MTQKKKKKQVGSGPASSRPLLHHRWPPVLRSPRQRRHHHHTPAAALGPPLPHLGSSTRSSAARSLGRRVSREGLVAPLPGRGGREPPHHSRIEEGVATPRPEPVPPRPDPAPDGVPALPPCPGKKEVRGEEEASRHGRIQCRTTPLHCRRTSGRRVVGEEEAGHRVMAGDARGGSGAPAAAATDEIGGAGRGGGRGGAGRGQRKREESAGGTASRAEEEGGAGRPWSGLPRAAGRGRGAGSVGLGVGCSFYTMVDQG